MKFYKRKKTKKYYLEKYPFLHGECKSENFIQSNYFLLSFSRHIILHIIVPFGHSIPLIIMPSMILINISILILIIIYKPFKMLEVKICSFICELFINLALFCGLIIAVFDYKIKSGKYNNDEIVKFMEYKFNFGWTIVISNIAILYILIINNTRRGIYYIYKKIKIIVKKDEKNIKSNRESLKEIQGKIVEIEQGKNQEINSAKFDEKSNEIEEENDEKFDEIVENFDGNYQDEFEGKSDKNDEKSDRFEGKSDMFDEKSGRYNEKSREFNEKMENFEDKTEKIEGKSVIIEGKK